MQGIGKENQTRYHMRLETISEEKMTKRILAGFIMLLLLVACGQETPAPTATTRHHPAPAATFTPSPLPPTAPPR
jgi:uncharacterized lipoprotein YajG